MSAIPVLLRTPKVVVVDKPAEMLSVPARFADDPRPVLGRLLEQQIGSRIWPVHRLDFEVSGVMVYACDPEAHRLLNRLFETHQVQKTYQALSEATNSPLPEGQVEWRSRLLRGKKRTYERPHGEPSLTRARCLALKVGGGPSVALWELEPHTGRSHQLRFEMAKHGFPILGDELYGSPWIWEPGIALRACRLEFPGEAAEALGLSKTLSVEPLIEPQELVRRGP